jgi:hypothetical protein
MWPLARQHNSLTTPGQKLETNPQGYQKVNSFFFYFGGVPPSPWKFSGIYG